MYKNLIQNYSEETLRLVSILVLMDLCIKTGKPYVYIWKALPFQSLF